MSSEDKCFVENKREFKQKRFEIQKKCIIICIAAVLLLSGYSSCYVLQTSINVEAGLGSVAVTVTYCTSIVCCLLFAPFLLRLFGVKKVLISAEICYIVYVCANIYPNRTTLIIGGILAGYGEGFYWLILYIVLVYYGKVYTIYSSKSAQECIMKFCGLGFGIVQFNQILGNTFVFFIFHFVPSSFNETKTNILMNNTVKSSKNRFVVNTTDDKENKARNIAHCGLNDCQDPNITSDNIDQYVPRNPVVIYVLIGCCLLLMIIGTLLHVCLMSDMPLDILNSTNSTDNEEMKDTKVKKYEKSFDVSLLALKDTFFQLVQCRQLLITPITIGFGYTNGFLYAEVTRAYASCMLGVNQVGTCVISYSSAFIVCCAVVGRFCSGFGRTTLILIAFLLQLGSFVAFLFWTPSPETTWIVYLFFGLFGLYGSEKFKNKEVSLTIFNMLTSVGIALQFGVSTLLCVREKVYIVIAILCSGTTLLAVREFLDKRRFK